MKYKIEDHIVIQNKDNMGFILLYLTALWHITLFEDLEYIDLF